jgi:hypothetical protein
MKRFMMTTLALLTLSGAAWADHRYGGATLRFGPDCKRIQRQTGQDTVVVGTVLGGQNRRGRWGDGTFRDYRTFQACFATVDACQMWAGRTQAHHPHPPGYARCTPVYVGLQPPHRKVRVQAIRTRG